MKAKPWRVHVHGGESTLSEPRVLRNPLRRSSATIRFSVALVALATTSAAAQVVGSIDLTWNTVDGGGWMWSSAGDFMLGGTIGQPDTGGPCAAGDFELIGGFWSMVIAPPCTEYAPPDFDHDCDVDLDDLVVFLPCAAGPLLPFSPDCAEKDLDGDADIDQEDFGLYQRCFSGSGGVANPRCAAVVYGSSLTLSIPDGAEGQTVLGTVQRSGPTAEALLVDLAVDASHGADVAVQTPVAIPAGQASADFTVTLVDDAEAEGPEAATVTASAADVNPGADLITITDNDLALSVVAPGGLEGTVIIGVVSRNGPLAEALIVNLGVDPAHAADANVQPVVHMPPWQPAATFIVTLVYDGIRENAEAATLTATAPGFNPGTGILMIIDYSP